MKPIRSLSSSLRRARARRHSDGAVMFIVVVTLGLLAAMGVYGLTATQAEIRSAGHMREALQAQRAGEHGLVMAAETLNPGSVSEIINSMSGTKRTTICKTAMPYVGAQCPVPPQHACRKLDENEMKIFGNTVNTWTAVPAFSSDSFGAVASIPKYEIELSNPVDVPPPAGYPANTRFTQVTVTAFVVVRSTIDPLTPAQSVVTGRGRLTVGPITGPPQCAP